MFFKFSDEAQKLLLLSLKEKNKLNDAFIGTEHVFLAALSMNNSNIVKVLNDNDIFYDKFISFFKKKELSNKSNYYIFTPLMNDIFNDLSSNRNKKNSDVTCSEIIVEILNHVNSKALLILKKMDIDIKKLYKSLNVSSKKKNYKKGIINELGVNLNEKFSNSKEVVLEREEEIDMIIEVLCCKNKNNPILIGDAGVGKTAIVEELARRINNHDVPYQLQNKKIYSIAMASLVAGTKYRGEFEDKINKLIEEVENSDDIILFIDEIHTLVGAGGADGAIDASNILKPYLARGNIKIIGATTNDEYKNYFANDKALSRRFQVVNIDEPNTQKVRNILLGIRDSYEDFHNVKISDQLIDKIIYYADKYVKNRKFPDKAIDILDEVCVLSSIVYNKEYSSMINLDREMNKIIKLKNKSIIDGDYKEAIKYSHDEKSIQNKMGKIKRNIFSNRKIVEVKESALLKVMERKTNIPFHTINNDRNKILKKINKYMSNSIFSNELTKKIISFTTDIYSSLVNNSFTNTLYVRSNKYGLNDYFIDEYINIFFPKSNLIHIDIDNFRNVDDLLKSNDIYNKNSSFIEKIKNNSFSIVVITNINNADYSIKDFFDKINRYGYYISRDDEKIDFSNTLFIYNLLLNEKIGFNNNGIKDDEIIDIDDISPNKLKKRIKNIFIKNNYTFSNEVITKIFDKIMVDRDNISNIELFIRKEMSNLGNFNEKKETIKV